VLRFLGEPELRARPGERSYRLLAFPSFTSWTSFRLEIDRDGKGALTTVVAPNLDMQPDVTASWRSERSLSKAQVAEIERIVALSKVEQILTDRRAWRTRLQCYDGDDVVFEASAKGLYRYVNRNSCDPDFNKLGSLEDLFFTLSPEARRRLRIPRTPFSPEQ